MKRGERKESISTFSFFFAFGVGFIDALFRGWFAICRVTFGPRRRVISRVGVSLQPACFLFFRCLFRAFFPRLYELTPRSYTMNRVLECGIISNLSSSRESYVLFVNSSRRDKSFLPRKIATVRIDGESST